MSIIIDSIEYYLPEMTLDNNELRELTDLLKKQEQLDDDFKN